MNAVSVEATRWAHGWELEISEHEHTQVKTLSKARQQVVDFLDTVYPEVDHSDWDITIVPNLGGLSERVVDVRRATRSAALAQEEAAAQTRSVVKGLRDLGITGTDIGFIMGLSRARISQLARG